MDFASHEQVYYISKGAKALRLKGEGFEPGAWKNKYR